MTDERRKILIVDDDADTRGVVSDTLFALGVETSEAGSGPEALEKLEREGLPDVLVLDVMMPVMTGFEVCRHFKALPGAELVPVIMLTAKDSIKDIVSGLDGGADDYLTKPFHYEELQARVRALLRVRELNLHLQRKNEELAAMQEKLVAKERQALVGELAGAAAHELGQPLAAILLNIHLVEKFATIEDKGQSALHAIKQDTKRMKKIVEELRSADAQSLTEYATGLKILSLKRETT
ncbi:MAG: response regulator [Bdellovibrionales bacterium]|nr:response regulator [Bdellovibrionales bacterium]